MKTHTEYECERCGKHYSAPANALRCERSADPPRPCEPPCEVRLRNRTGDTYTVATATALRLSPLYEWCASLPPFTPGEILHRWCLVLAERVILDHKWGEYRGEVEDFYLVHPDEAERMVRCDNCSCGPCARCMPLLRARAAGCETRT